MKKTLLLLCSIALLVMANGCSCMNNTEKGALTGGAIGTGIGGLLGAATGHPGAGMLVGGALGTGLGAVAGSDQDRYERRRDAFNAARTPPLSLQEIVAMSQRGVPDQQIINQIHASGAAYRLTSDDLIYLNDQRVSAQVISVLQQRPVVQPVVVHPRRGPVVVYDYPPPPPPPPIGFGVGVVVR